MRKRKKANKHREMVKKDIKAQILVPYGRQLPGALCTYLALDEIGVYFSAKQCWFLWLIFLWHFIECNNMQMWQTI